MMPHMKENMMKFMDAGLTQIHDAQRAHIHGGQPEPLGNTDPKALVQSSLNLFNNYLLQWRVVGWPPSLQGSFRRLGRKAQRGDAEQGLEARRGSGVGGDQRLSIEPRPPATTCFLRASMGSPRLRVGLFA